MFTKTYKHIAYPTFSNYRTYEPIFIRIFLFLALNLAVGKPAEQSSDYAPIPQPPENAVDGMHSTDSGGPCTHTRREAQPWWGVDLEQIYSIATVKILNRMEST